MLPQTIIGPLATVMTLGLRPGFLLLALVGGILGGSLSHGVVAGEIRAGERANAVLSCCSVALALVVLGYCNVWYRIEDNFDHFPWQNILPDQPLKRKQLMVAPCPFTGLNHSATGCDGPMTAATPRGVHVQTIICG